MDYRQFFDDLKECYSSRGFPFDYDFDKSVSKSCNSLGKSLGPLASFFSKQLSRRLKSENFVYSNKGKDFRANYSGDFKIPMWKDHVFPKQYFFVPRLFYGVEDMVYSLAWELSCRIGRLPDALHARMVFSLDSHRAIRRYIEKHGV